MNSEELRQTIKEFYDSPLSFLEISDGDTYVKMKKPVGQSAEMPNIVVAPVVGAAGIPAMAMQSMEGLSVQGVDGAVLTGTAGITASNTAVTNKSGDLGSAIQDANVAQGTSTTTAKDDSLVEVTSPIVGVFYEAPAPGEKPFVREGDHVNQDEVICLMEAMKMINEIKAPCNGTIKQILVKNAETVGFGDVLMRIEAD